MKKLLTGLVAAVALATFGCENTTNEETELQGEQQELEEATQRSYDYPEERREEIQEAQQDVREAAREEMEHRDDAVGGSGDGMIDAEELNTQEAPHKE